MSDRYQQLTSSPPGRLIAKRLGAPRPVRLRRYEPGQALLDGPAVVGSAPGGRLAEPVAGVLRNAGAQVDLLDPGATPAHAQGSSAPTLGALVFDATGISSVTALRTLYDFFAATIRRLGPCGRLLVLGSPPRECSEPGEAIAQRALEGFVRAAAKELRDGATGQLVHVARGAEDQLESTLRFLASSRSAYVSGQRIEVGKGASETPADWERPLDGKVALVTGAARGIGEAIAVTLARDGAQVVCLDVPGQGDALTNVANRIGGWTLALDITGPDAPNVLVEHVRERHGGVDVVVHNAGVTRDKTLGRMSPEQWDTVLAINLAAPERLTTALLDAGALRAPGRVVCVSSVSGIAGNRGQTNYATSKAGVIGLVEALAPRLAARPATINAVAPGFIETQMTAAMPLVTREGGRRMNSVAQGGLPVDVAETIAWLGSPASGGVNGNVVRVCGQSLLGA